MSDYPRPLPVPDPTTLPYWESVKAHAMRIQRCNDTGKFFFYPRGVSPFTLSKNISWEPVSGSGTLYTYTIVHRHYHPGFASEIPYVVALVELDEGVRIMADLVDVEPDPQKIKIGSRVEVVYDDVTEEVTLPRFRLAGS
ncbi:MAG: hypothetical protein DCC58_15895 [Chloroflexi bacterium]|nr:MAG: hypothetical protein DCC58_15895 [Chloroflexota bacterium]